MLVITTPILLEFSDIHKNKDNEEISYLLYVVKVSFIFVAIYSEIKLNYFK